MRAMRDAGVTDPGLIYFVDDSALNIDAAQVKIRFGKMCFCQQALITLYIIEIGMDNGTCRW